MYLEWGRTGGQHIVIVRWFSLLLGLGWSVCCLRQELWPAGDLWKPVSLTHSQYLSPPHPLTVCPSISLSLSLLLSLSLFLAHYLSLPLLSPYICIQWGSQTSRFRTPKFHWQMPSGPREQCSKEWNCSHVHTPMCSRLAAVMCWTLDSGCGLHYFT